MAEAVAAAEALTDDSSSARTALSKVYLFDPSPSEKREEYSEFVLYSRVKKTRVVIEVGDTPLSLLYEAVDGRKMSVDTHFACLPADRCSPISVA